MLVALSLVVLLVIAALVLDVGYGYSVGRQEQTVADVSALAAARYLPGAPSTACAAGWDYVKANLTSLPSGAVSPCGGFPSSCDTATAAANYVATSTGDYTVTFRYPVPDGTQDGVTTTDALLGSRRDQDGSDQCARFGVVIRHKNAAFFSPIGGVGPMHPVADAVAREATGTELTKVANLVSLDPTGCTGIKVSGTNTAVMVGTAALPGSIAVDSDGLGSTNNLSSSCNGGQTTVSSQASSGSAYLYACPNPQSQNSWCDTSGPNGDGQILLYSMPGADTTCSTPACSSTDVSQDRLGPQPVTNSERVTRDVADYAFNCQVGGYPTAYDGLVSIPACYTGTTPYISDLISTVQTDAANPANYGFTVIDSSSPYGGCNPTTHTYPAGENVWVSCSNFNIGSGVSVTFEGNVVFSHLATGSNSNKSANVSVTGGSTPGSLRIEGNPNVASLATDYSDCLTSICLNESSAQAAYVYINGNLGSSGKVAFNDAAVYVTAYQSKNVTGDPTNFGCSPSGTGNYVESSSTGSSQAWSAPTEGPLENLALWSEGVSNKFQFTGGGNSSIDGVFFTPCAEPFTISGGFTNPQTAQFISFQLDVNGGSTVEMVPDPTRLLVTSPTGAELIR